MIHECMCHTHFYQGLQTSRSRRKKENKTKSLLFNTLTLHSFPYFSLVVWIYGCSPKHILHRIGKSSTFQFCLLQVLEPREVTILKASGGSRSYQVGRGLPPPLFLCIDHLGRLYYLSLLFCGTLHSNGNIIPFLLSLSLLFFPQLSVSFPQMTILPFLHFFFLGMVLIPVSCTMSQTSVHSSSGTLSIRSSPLNLFLTSTV